VSENFVRHEDAKCWVIDAERQIDRGESPDPSSVGRLKAFGGLIDLHISDLSDVGKAPRAIEGRHLDLLKRELGRLKMVEIDRECVIRFGCRRSKQGAGATTIGISLKVRFEPGDFESGIDEQTPPAPLLPDARFNWFDPRRSIDPTACSREYGQAASRTDRQGPAVGRIRVGELQERLRSRPRLRSQSWRPVWAGRPDAHDGAVVA